MRVFCVYERDRLGELIFSYLAKITLPKSVVNWLGNVFVPNGIYGITVTVFRGLHIHFHTVAVTMFFSQEIGYRK